MREWLRRKFWLFVIAVNIIAFLSTSVDIVDTLFGKTTLIEFLKKIYQEAPIVLLIVFFLFLVINIVLEKVLPYREIRELYVKLKPNPKNLEKAFGQIFLDSSIASKLWPVNGNPPIFIVGKDKDDIDRIIKDDLFVDIYSFKWASTTSVAFLANVASQLGRKWAQDKNRYDRMRLLEQDDVLFSCLDIDAFEALEEKDKKISDRSIISISGGDSNLMSGTIFRDFERRYNYYAPLRFSSRYTAEVIIAETEHHRHVLVEETNPDDERTGIIWAANQGKSNALWIILAGLARPGTEASCIIFCHLISQEKSENKITTNNFNQEPLYKYSSKFRALLPCAISILDDNNNADAILMGPNYNMRAGKSVNWPDAEIQDTKILIVIGGIPRSEQSIERNRQILTRDASAIIDFVVNYKIFHPNSSIKVLQTEHSNVKLSTIKQSNFDNIIIIGNEEQNSLLKEICDDKDFSNLNNMYSESLKESQKAGIILVDSYENKRFIIVYGYTGKLDVKTDQKPDYLQAAIRGLIKITRTDSLSELKKGIMKCESAGHWRRYVTDVQIVNVS